MPKKDGTGPMGTGTMSGRGAGTWAGNDNPDFGSSKSGVRMRGSGAGSDISGKCGGRGNRRSNSGENNTRAINERRCARERGAGLGARAGRH